MALDPERRRFFLPIEGGVEMTEDLFQVMTLLAEGKIDSEAGPKISLRGMEYDGTCYSRLPV